MTMTSTTPTRPTPSLSGNITSAFARRGKDKTRRELRFLGTLRRTLAVYLPELLQGCAPEAAKRAVQWRTVRVRPEIIATIEGLQKRYTAQHSGKQEVSASEV
ncbi:MAG: hypothetical protein V4630_13175, partial [Pseudomonadota bacterium]